MARVVEVTTYPVKGCAGTPSDSVFLTPAGPAHDRAFMVVGEDGVFRTQRTHPRLARIRPRVLGDGASLVLDSADGDGRWGSVRVDVRVDGPRREVEMFGDAYRGIDQGDDAAGWLSDCLGSPSRLVRVPPEHDRVADGLHPGTSGYADSNAVHLLSRASLAGLNSRMAERGAPPLATDRFRPNIVVDGDATRGGDWADEPHAEDLARRIAVGEAELGYARLAVRCAVTMVDQADGVRSGPEPLRSLASYRRAAGGGVVFGAKFSVLRPGKLSLGDELTVLEWGESEG